MCLPLLRVFSHPSGTDTACSRPFVVVEFCSVYDLQTFFMIRESAMKIRAS